MKVKGRRHVQVSAQAPELAGAARSVRRKGYADRAAEQVNGVFRLKCRFITATLAVGEIDDGHSWVGHS